jgi:predicted metal-dependent phosphoesterase TrpH
VTGRGSDVGKSKRKDLSPALFGVYAVDLHTHSRFFHVCPGEPTRYDRIGLRLMGLGARLRRLDGFAVTNHDYTYSAEIGLPTIPGIEVSTTEGHVVVVGPNPPRRTEAGGMTPEETVTLAHERSCAAILAHPYRNSAARNADADFDAVELNGKNPEHIRQSRRLAERLDLPLVGGSDAHYPVEIGRAYTLVDAPELTPEAVVDAIRGARVEPVLKLGRVDRVLDRAYTNLHGRKGWMDEPSEADADADADVRSDD